MADVKRNWDLLTDEERDARIQEIIDFFDHEREEKIGVIAARELLDFFLQTLGVQIYNKGVEDSILFMRDRFEMISIDMDSILKK